MKEKKEIVKIGQLELTFLLNGEDTNNSLVMFELIIPSGAKVPMPHYHKDVDEVIYGLDGVTVSTVDGKKIEITPGERLFILRGIVHHHDNKTAYDAKSLFILTPAAIGIEYFKELGELIKPGIPPDPNKVAETMIKYGLIPVVQ